MTRLRAALVSACLAASIVSLLAADTPALDRAAVALGVDAIQSLEFEASGRYYQFGQAPAPELPWPAFDVTGYTATLDYGRASVHARVPAASRSRSRDGHGRTPIRPRIRTRPAATAGTSRRLRRPSRPTSPNATPSCGRHRRAS